jgi:predicted metalloprotease
LPCSVWGYTARAALQITDDLGEALTAAHAIGDDTLGRSDERTFTHGSSEQRKRWFRRGFDSGDARRCDTFAVKSYQGALKRSTTISSEQLQRVSGTQASRG